MKLFEFFQHPLRRRPSEPGAHARPVVLVKQLSERDRRRMLRHFLALEDSDRLLRFGSEIIFQICHFFGVKITILQDEPNKPPTEQICTDLVEIMTVFCSKLYGHRSHQNRKCSTLSNPKPTAA